MGPQEVGKSTIRKWLFEGDSLYRLLENPMEPTYGYENYSYNLLQELGVFDLAGQEQSRWFDENPEIFSESDIILNILDARSAPKIIIDYINKVIKVQKKFAISAKVFFLIHKIDLIDDIQIFRLKSRIKLFKEQFQRFQNENLNIFYTSIKPNYLSDTINTFVEIFKIAGVDQESELDAELIQMNIRIFNTLINQKVLSIERLGTILETSRPNLQNIIGTYEEAELIHTKRVGKQILVYVSDKGKKYYNEVLTGFSDLTVKKAKKTPESVEVVTVKKEIINLEELIYGLMISDSNGKTLIIIEMQENSLKDVLNRSKNPDFDLELVPMFLNAMSKFAEEINVKDLSSFRVQGANLRMSSLSRKNLTLTLFSHPNLHIDYIRDDLSDLFDDFLTKYKDFLETFSKTGNATKFLEFIPEAKKSLQNMLEKYENIESDLSKFNLEDVKKIYQKLSSSNDAKLPIEDQLKMKTLKVKLLEAIIAEDMSAFQSIESDIQKYI